MSNAAVSYIGADAGVDSTLAEQRALYLKLFSGEVITAFEDNAVFLDKHTVRTISAGKSAQFPVIGLMPAAEYHVPGEEILGQEIKQGERVLNIDSMLIQHVFLSDIDEAMSHFEVRSKYSMMMGRGLSDTFDNHIGRNLVACGSASAVAGLSTAGEGVIVDDADLGSATDATLVQAFIDFLFQAAQTLDEKKVPKENRFCVLKPADYYKIVKTVQSDGFSAIHRDYGGAGSFAAGNVIAIAGITLISTNRVPTADYTGETFHAVDCRNIKAIVFTPDAVGTVKLLDLSLQSEWDIRRQGTLMVARYAMGHGVLQPECVVIGRTAAPA